MICATRIFDFIEKQESVTVQYYEFYSANFNKLRACLFEIISILNSDADRDCKEKVNHMWWILLRWLTSPVKFNEATFEELFSQLGHASLVGNKWGHAVVVCLEKARAESVIIQQMGNPVRIHLLETVRRLRITKQRFKIFCYRSDRPLFESIILDSGDEPLSDNDFIHSAAQYRNTDIFDALIKIGPLRTQGYSSTPGIIKSAPRFKEVIQLVWSGCNDEPNFGNDPVTIILDDFNAAKNGNVGVGSGATIPWLVQRHLCQFYSDEYSIEDDFVDEIEAFRHHKTSDEWRRALMIRIQDGKGLLYPPNAKELFFELGDKGGRVDFWPVDEIDQDKFFVIRHKLDRVDLGEVRAKNGELSEVWKKKLEEVYKATPEQLIALLHKAGLNIKNLETSIPKWYAPASTVIHAPQRKEYFAIMIKVLFSDNELLLNGAERQKPTFWKDAWDEIQHARVEAIRHGRQESLIIEEQLQKILHECLPEIIAKASEADFFQILIPSSRELRGNVFFNKVIAVEDGFRVPDSDMKKIKNLMDIDQWRE